MSRPRIETGAVRAATWAALDSPPMLEDSDAPAKATQLFRRFLREVVDPKVRFGVKAITPP